MGVHVCSMGVEVRHSWGMTEMSPVGVMATPKVRPPCLPYALC